MNYHKIPKNNKMIQHLKVLYLEDSPQDIDILSELLGASGFELEMDCTASEKEFVNMLRKNKYDVILADFKLPGFEGSAALRLTKEICLDTPFIIVSGTIGEEKAIELIKLGADDFILKDRMARLPIAIHDVIEKKQTQMALRESEELIFLFMQHSPIYVFIKEVSPTGSRVLVSSDNFIEMTGIPSSEMKGKTMQELFPTEFAAKITEDDRAVVTNGKILELEEHFNNRIYRTLKFPIERNGKTLLAGYTIDISERKQAEKALEKSEFLYRSLSENSTDLIARYDKQFRHLYLNPSAISSGRYSLEQEYLGKTIHEVFVPEEGAALWEKYVQTVFDTGESIETDDIFQTPDGQRYLNTKFVAEQDINDIILSVLSISRDITERKKAEVALQEYSKFNTEVIKSAQEGIIVYGLDMKYLLWNPFMENFTGIPASEVLGKHPTDLFPFLKDAGVIEIIEKALKGESSYAVDFPFNIPITGKSGWTSDTTGPLRNVRGEIIGVISTIRDITERKQAEAELTLAKEKIEKNEQRLRLATASGQLGIWDWDVIRNVMIWDDRMFELYGINDDAFVNNLDVWTNGLHPEDKQRAIDECYSALKGEKDFNTTFRVIHPNGTILYLKAEGIVIRDNNNQPFRMIGVNKDVTKNKINEEELIKAKEKAEESDHLKTAFLHNISHEIRTPMNSIIGFSELLNEPDLHPEKRKKFTNVITNSSYQLLSIISDIISIATLESGQEKIIEKEIDLNSMLKSLHEQFMSTGELKNVSFTLKQPSLNENEAKIIADETKLIQVLTNLISNALKFTVRGIVNFGYNKKGNDLEFYIEDTGIGIAPELHQIIFDRFRQVDGTAQQFGGSGLGLSISKGYVDLMGGRIWLTSELGKGSTFYFTIPLKNGSNIIRSEAQSANDQVHGFETNKTILVAEDEDSNFMLIEELIEELNVNIIRAVNGIEAINICKTNQAIDLVLMDIKMPLMNGDEATKKIRAFAPELPIIAQTAYSTEAEKEKILASGCNDFISKPLKRELLVSKIKEQLYTV
jgi:PAS domain S-box-containing protein